MEWKDIEDEQSEIACMKIFISLLNYSGDSLAVRSISSTFIWQIIAFINYARPVRVVITIFKASP